MLGQRGLQRDGVVVNRVQQPPADGSDAELEGLAPALRRRVQETLEEARALAARDEAGVAALRAGTAPVPLLAVPRYSSEVHDLRALWRAGSHLVGESGAPGTEAIV